MLRLALEDDLLDAIAWSNSRRTGYLGFERRSFGEAANSFQAFLPQTLLIGSDFLGRFKSFVGFLPTLRGLIRL